MFQGLFQGFNQLNTETLHVSKKVCLSRISVLECAFCSFTICGPTRCSLPQTKLRQLCWHQLKSHFLAYSIFVCI